ncbi:collagen-like protein [Archangium gephyra]|uniref:DUF7151 family protein n=1 Tax=Archangium gephyra TaxID=48 RepID=UPI0035D3EDFD
MTAAEAPGTLCATGGVRFVVGADANRNGTLDDAEIDSTLTRYICNGTQGLKGDKGDTGAMGLDGLSTLVATSDELPGSNCEAGGTRMQVGRDANRNGTLDGAEVEASHTRYVCKGIQGVKGDKGDTGATGAPGAKGDTGDKGDTGAKGDTGGAGAKGDKGDMGATGAPGAKGDKGDTGPMGPPGVMYVRTKVVSPGATDAESGAALRAAIDGITDGKTWRVKVEPGVYDLGATPLVLKPGIHLEGSGEKLTTLRSSTATQGTVVGASGAVLSSLTVENIGGGTRAYALYSVVTDFDFHDLVAIARNGSDRSWAIVLSTAQGTFENVRAFAYGSGSSYPSAFRCYSCSVSLIESQAEAQGGAQSVGVYVATGTVYLRNVTSKATGATDNWGVYTDGDASLVNVEAIGAGGARSTGFFVGEGNGTVRNSVLSASGATEANEGLSSFTDFATYGVVRTITVHNSVISGTSASVYRQRYFDVRIGQSQLSGPVTQRTTDPTMGKYTCVGTYDGAFVPTACP